MACLGYDATFLIGQQLLRNNASSKGYISQMRLRLRSNGQGIENVAAPVVLFHNGELIETDAQ
jgi:hypothetical protein